MTQSENEGDLKLVPVIEQEEDNSSPGVYDFLDAEDEVEIKMESFEDKLKFSDIAAVNKENF